MSNHDAFVHISYIIERHDKFPDDIKNRFTIMKATASEFDQYIIQDVSTTNNLPVDYTGTSISIDETDLNRYKIDIRLKIDERKGITQKKLLDLADKWTRQLKSQNKNRRVICHTSLRLDDGYHPISQS